MPSSFGISAQSSAGVGLGAHLTADRSGTVNRRLFSEPVFSKFADTSTRSWVTHERTESGKAEDRRKGVLNWSRGRLPRPSQAELPKQEQIDGGTHRVRAPMKVAHSVEPFDG